MPVQLGAPHQANFEQPLDLLQDCHRRIEHFLAVLTRVVDASTSGQLTDETRRALEAALRYFKEAAPRHTLDEEESLFPRLRQSPAEGVHDALARVDALHADHLRADAWHNDVDALGRQWLATGQLSPEDRATLKARLTDLTDLYRGHIHIEDTAIFPLARKSLPPDQLAAIGQEMKARRAEIPRHANTPDTPASHTCNTQP
jgi:hemerythrin-like domain-containing protein